MTTDEMVELVHAISRSDDKLHQIAAELRRIPSLEAQVEQLTAIVRYWDGKTYFDHQTGLYGVIQLEEQLASIIHG